MGGQPGIAYLFERDRAVVRHLSLILRCAGFTTEVRTDGWDAPLPEHPGAVVLLVGEVAAADAVRAALARSPGYGVIYKENWQWAPEGGPGQDPAAWLGEPGVWALLGSRRLDAELLAVARRAQGWPLPPLQGCLLWGAKAFEAEIRTTAGREAAVARVVSLCQDELGVPRRIGDSAGEVAHELITNALYDAPVDAQGRKRHDGDRTAQIELPPADRVTFRFGADGQRLGIEVVDRFGGLARSALLGSLRQAALGQVDRRSGGAGIGLGLVHRAVHALQCEVVPGLCTRITALLDLDRPREGGRSLIFPLPLPSPLTSVAAP